MDRPLSGRVAVVAGASRGIGKGIAIEVAAAGATVYAAGRTAMPTEGASGSLQETVAAIEGVGGTGVAVGCDFTDDDDIARLFDRVRGDQGRLDLFAHSVFNAKQFGPTIGRPFWELPTSIWHDVVDVGTRSAYVAATYAAPLLIDSGGGLIVHVSARGAARYRYNVAYGVGKAALDKMTADMATELGDHNVAVVSLWPNVTRTERMPASGPISVQGMEAPIDASELETPRYTGRAVTALCADPDVMARSGQVFWVAQLAEDYGFTDEDGRGHAVP